MEVLRHYPVVSWLEDYLEEVEEIMGKDPWIHGIAEDLPALKILDFSQAKGLLSKTPRLGELFADLGSE